MIVGIDFDGTCVTHEFPEVGIDIGAQKVLNKLVANGHKLILFTMRSDSNTVETDNPDIVNVNGNYLTYAQNWFIRNGIPLYGVNVNPEQYKWTTSPKAYCELYIDDAALGCPLKYDTALSNRPFVDWVMVEKWLIAAGLIY